MSLVTITNNLNSLEIIIDERLRLINILKLTPSSNDNFDLINQLGKITKLFKASDSDTPKFKQLVNQYNDLLDQLNDDSTINIEEYKYTIKKNKNVRFKDDSNDLRNELMGTTKFKSYKDDPEESDKVEFNDFKPNSNRYSDFDGSQFNQDLSNQDLFGQNQQLLSKQDEDLDMLHDSVKIQKSMGLNINEEIDSHLIMLNDLENGVESSQLRLNSANNRLREFRRKFQENGSLITIVVLTIILILLLVVLN
ncbi:syntaxin-8 [[Candida] jaroonii]|uniref:Syntaxin-8 n=1 Tax=[Candida] jaroonii TaxID=467808 RepID=A0ACA9Y4L3_9ASCO|nr:syntaxin-8 [[Candida] jaroonii]